MSTTSVKRLYERTKTAPDESKIAVFITDTGYIDAVFDSTVWTQQAIAAKPANYVGSFCYRHGIEFIRGEIDRAAERCGVQLAITF